MSPPTKALVSLWVLNESTCARCVMYCCSGQTRRTVAEYIQRCACTRCRGGRSVDRRARANNLTRGVGRCIERIGDVLEYIGWVGLGVVRCAVTHRNFPIEISRTPREVAVQAHDTARYHLRAGRPPPLQIGVGAGDVELIGIPRRICNGLPRPDSDAGIEIGTQRQGRRVVIQRGLDQGAVAGRQKRIIEANDEIAIDRAAFTEQVGVVGRLGDQIGRMSLREVAFTKCIDVVIDLKVHQGVDVDALGRRQQVADLGQPQAVAAARENLIAGLRARIVRLQLCH